MLFDPARHEPLCSDAWDDARARDAIERIVRDTESAFDDGWPMHPLDADDEARVPVHNLYFGACGVIWALRHLEAVGMASLRRSYRDVVAHLLPRNRAWLASFG